LIAVGRAVRYQHRLDAADFGIIVRDDFQRNGIGKYLLDLLVLAVREREVKFLCGEMFRNNAPMFRVIDDLPYVTDWVLDGATASFEIDLTSPK
jgi:GNAT superfamily N-acetyltransferase